MIDKRCLTDDEMDKIKHCLMGTCRSVLSVMGQYDIDEWHEDEVNDRLLDGNPSVELCLVCEWWHETCELEYDEDLGGGVCSQCRPEDEED